MNRISLDWRVGHAKECDVAPARWVAATVPGAVQLDWAQAESWPPYWMGVEFERYRWMEDVYWTYAAEVKPLPLEKDQRIYLVCGGVDYAFRICWNGEVLHMQEGMFTPVTLDLTDRIGRGGRLEVRLEPAPKAPSPSIDRVEARDCAKPAVAYGWDWHPRLIPLGIWEDTFLEVRPAAHLEDAELKYQLSDDHAQADLVLEAAVSAAANGHALRWTLLSPGGKPVANGQTTCAGRTACIQSTLAKPELWWCHDLGPQPLYRSRVELLAADGKVIGQREQRVGFRRVRLVMHEGAWKNPATFPKGRSHPPVTFELNGRTLFARGSNWVPPEIFPGTITADSYRPLLHLAREANFNLLRSWGGGIVNKESFFDQCDELGLMVWQEFPLGCNPYPDTPHYMGVLDQESRSIIRRVRRHACLALWCGGNELFNVWSGMTDQSHPLRLLNANTLALDPRTPFIPTSPIDGMGHGDYRFRDEAGREVYQIYATARHTAYSEFGCPGPSPLDYLKTFILEAELWPVRPGAAWQAHHAIGAWDMDATTWLCTTTLEHYFGEAPDLPALIARGQWLQAEGYKCIFEEARRQKPVSAMALNWCYNESWPCAANNSIVNWPAKPKPSFAAVKAACRSVMASARIPKFTWRGGEEFRAEIWLLNDSHAEIAPGAIDAVLRVGSVEIVLVNWQHPAAKPDRHVAGPEVRGKLPVVDGADRLILSLRVRGAAGRDAEYTLLYRPQIEAPSHRVPGFRLLRKPLKD